jgi:2-dehydro-3-deoxyphosphogluconate aldolase/(4S)-4-hydroxy-2-oxoglutarate aldolase
LTPTEVYHAWDTGADFVKIFPCNSLGGVSYIKSLRTPLPDIALIPVGGVTVDNAGDFIRAGCAALGVGNGIVDKQAVAAARFIDVTQAALKYMKAIHDARTPI